MYKAAGLLAAAMFVATSASALPAKPSEVLQTFVKSDALQELLEDHSGYKSITIGVVYHLSDAVETLCNQKSRSRSIVAVTLVRDSGTNEFYFQTPSSPHDLKRCIVGDNAEL